MIFFPENRIDIIFAMAVCAHINKWRELIQFCAKISPVLVFEANGSEQKMGEQVEELKRNYRNCRMIYGKSVDDGGNRSLWLAEN